MGGVEERAQARRQVGGLAAEQVDAAAALLLLALGRPGAPLAHELL